MRASRLEYRFRFALHGLIFALGFWAPWNYWLHADPAGPNAHVWGLLSANLAMAGWMGIGAAFNLLLVVGIACAAAAAALRTWGAAYLGSDVVQDGGMHTADSPTPFAGAAVPGVLTDGPFRRMRNPLYVGTFLHTLALALLMPRSGAIFAIVAIAVLQVRLMLAEESYLRVKVGAAYAAYCALVPRILPALRARVAAGGRQARWPQAVAGEIYFWGVAAVFAGLGWRYNAALLIQGVVVALGVSLVVRALVGRSGVVRE